MNRRNVLTTLGATALGASVLFGGAVNTFAQDADTPPAVAQADTQDVRAAFEAERAQAYNDFVAALAGELGDDEAAVDAAIRTALTQAVDARLAAGEIDEERAAAAKAVIQVTDAPLMAGFGRPRRAGRIPGTRRWPGPWRSGLRRRARRKGYATPGRRSVDQRAFLPPLALRKPVTKVRAHRWSRARASLHRTVSGGGGLAGLATARTPATRVRRFRVPATQFHDTHTGHDLPRERNLYSWRRTETPRRSRWLLAVVRVTPAAASCETIPTSMCFG